ncbi:MAG: hypothetical protein KJ737_01630 [Proteobacteria bacterium]|nr:hypothetical protein [Pseudomonadota bacterium]
MAENQITKGSRLTKISRHIALPFFIFFWPFIYLFRYVFPINGQYTAIGNDFGYLYYTYKVYLLANLADGHIPLWSPSEGCGFPFYSNPFAQMFYPLNSILLIWYKVFGRYNPIDHQAFTVLGISIFALGLFMWLRQLTGSVRAALFSALIMSVSFKITEIMRFPNAIHAAAWYPWILFAATGIMMEKSRKETVLYSILLVFSLISLCTAGYPYFIYYSLFLFIPYFMAFLIKPLRTILFGNLNIRWKRPFLALLLAGLVTLAICGPYLLSIKKLMDQTTDRTGQDFAYSTAHDFNFEDTVGALIFPPSCQTEGWYFFSVTAVLMILVFGTFHIKNCSFWPQSARSIEPSQMPLKATLFFLIWFCIISYITYGKNSYLFIFLWNHLPGFSSLRVWGRFNIILIPIISWWLSISYVSFESFISNEYPKESKKRHLFSPLTTATTLYLIIIAIQIYLYQYKRFDTYWINYFKALHAYDSQFIFSGMISFFILSAIIIKVQLFKPISKRFLSAIVTILVFIAYQEIYRVGTKIWTYEGNAQKQPVYIDTNHLYSSSFQYPRIFQNLGTISLTPQYRVNSLPNWYFNRYNTFLKNTESETTYRDILLGINGGRRAFISDEINHPTILAFLKDAVRYQTVGRMISYSGDELIWEVNMKNKAYFSFIDNWERGWKVYINGEPREIQLLFGTFKSVKLDQGLNKIKFAYGF